MNLQFYDPETTVPDTTNNDAHLFFANFNHGKMGHRQKEVDAGRKITIRSRTLRRRTESAVRAGLTLHVVCGCTERPQILVWQAARKVAGARTGGSQRCCARRRSFRCSYPRHACMLGPREFPPSTAVELGGDAPVLEEAFRWPLAAVCRATFARGRCCVRETNKRKNFVTGGRIARSTVSFVIDLGPREGQQLALVFLACEVMTYISPTDRDVNNVYRSDPYVSVIQKGPGSIAPFVGARTGF